MKKFDLVSALMNYHVVSDAEMKDVCATLRFLNDNESNSYKRENQSGHVTGSALVVDEKGNILLNHHKKANIWIQFGGHSDGESDTKNVALREVMEETGITNLKFLTEDIFDCAVYDIPANRDKGEPAHKHYDINFLIQALDTNYIVSSESTELRWCTPNEALQLVAGDKACVRMILKSQHYFQSLKKTEAITTENVNNQLYL